MCRKNMKIFIYMLNEGMRRYGTHKNGENNSDLLVYVITSGIRTGSWNRISRLNERVWEDYKKAKQ